MNGKRAASSCLLGLVSLWSTVGIGFAAGTDDTLFMGDQDTRKRVGIIAYCADMYHNAGDTGLQSNKVNIRDGGAKFGLAALVETPLGNWLLDGPFDNLGQFGAQNVIDYLAYDDGIDRVRDLQLIDGDLIMPTSRELIANFDIIIAYTDNKCGEPIPTSISIPAATALQQFIASPGKKLILTGFAFSSTLGFGNQLYTGGRSPLTKGGPENFEACTRDPFTTGCFVGTCPTGCTNVGNPPECQDEGGNICTVYQPVGGGVLGTNNPDQACREFLNNVRGPTSSSWATALTSANVAPGASLCLNYDDGPVNGEDTGVPFAAINAARNIVAINAFPPDAVDIQKFWFGCLLGDVVQYLSGDTQRCGEQNLFCY